MKLEKDNRELMDRGILSHSPYVLWVFFFGPSTTFSAKQILQVSPQVTSVRCKSQQHLISLFLVLFLSLVFFFSFIFPAFLGHIWCHFYLFALQSPP